MHPDGDPEEYAHWRIADIDGDLEDPEWEEVSSVNLTSRSGAPVTIGNKKAQARFRANGVWGPWSATVYAHTEAAPFDPRSRGDAAIWFRADTLTGYVADDAVPTLPNEGTDSGIAIAQSTSTKRALYKTAILNGLPSVKFDGSDDTYDISSLDTFLSTGPAAGLMTWLAVVTAPGSADQYVIGGYSGDTPDTWAFMGFGGTGDEVTAEYFRGTAAHEDLAGYVSGGRMIGVRQTATDLELYDNGALKVSTTQAGNPLASWNAPSVGMSKRSLFGANLYSSLHLHELIGFRGAISDATLSEAWQYLADKYGLTLDNAPAQPTATADNITSTGFRIRQTSAFSDPDGDAHAKTWYRVATDAAMTNLVESVQATGADLLEKTFTGKAASTTYYYDVADQDDTGAWGPRSEVGSVTTAAASTNHRPNTPTVTISLRRKVRTTLAPFHDADGDGQAAHQHRMRRVSTGEIEESPIINDTGDTYDFWCIIGEEYEFSGRYKDDSGAANAWSDWGAWSDPLLVTPPPGS